MSAGTSYVGEIMLWGSSRAPRGWYWCNGCLLKISENTALFSVLGTNYGGDGMITFALPDLRGRAPVGCGCGPGLSDYYTVGMMKGENSQKIKEKNLPDLRYYEYVNRESSSNDTPSDARYLGKSASSSAPSSKVEIYSDQEADTSIEGPKLGSGEPIDIRQPMLTVGFIICWAGIYPTRP